MDTSRCTRSLALASFLGIALVGCTAYVAARPDAAIADSDIDESYFYTSLSSQGSWVQNADFGWVWYPYNRDPDWRPYTVGHWVWTDYGEWMWDSDEPWGWATYHYGRWFLDPYYGWVWMPGRVWAPAWVSWRDCDDYVGWAPLGPWGYYDWDRHRYRDWDRYGHGDHGDHWDHGDRDHDHDRDHGARWGDHDRDDHDSWTFTRKRDFTNSRIDRVAVDRSHLSEVYRRSRELPPPSEQDERQGRGVSRGIDHRAIERASGHPIRAVRVEDDKAPREHGRGDENPGAVHVFRPKVNERKPDATPDRLGVAKPDGGRGGSHDSRGGGNDNRGGANDGRGGNDNRGDANDGRGGNDNRGGANDGRGGNDNRGGANDGRGGNDKRGGANDNRGGANDNRGGWNDGRGNDARGGDQGRGGSDNRQHDAGGLWPRGHGAEPRDAQPQPYQAPPRGHGSSGQGQQDQQGQQGQQGQGGGADRFSHEPSTGGNHAPLDEHVPNVYQAPNVRPDAYQAPVRQRGPEVYERRGNDGFERRNNDGGRGGMRDQPPPREAAPAPQPQPQPQRAPVYEAPRPTHPAGGGNPQGQGQGHGAAGSGNSGGNREGGHGNRGGESGWGSAPGGRFR